MNAVKSSKNGPQDVSRPGNPISDESWGSAAALDTFVTAGKSFMGISLATCESSNMAGLSLLLLMGGGRGVNDSGDNGVWFGS